MPGQKNNIPDKDRSPMTEKVDLEKSAFFAFSAFTTQEWVVWINCLLSGDLCEPLVEVSDEELHLVLARIYNNLENKRQRDRFAEAAKLIFETTPVIQQNARELYYLIELLTYLKPFSAKSLLRRYLKERSFLNIEYGQRNLHTMLLVANSKYDVDNDLVDFIYYSSVEIKEFKYLLVCMRILSTSGVQQFLIFLDVLIPFLNSNNDAMRLGRQLKGVFYRTGYRHFCDWYSERAVKIPLPFPAPPDEHNLPSLLIRDMDLTYKSFYFFEYGLKETVFKSLNLDDPSNEDPYSKIIATQLHAYDVRYNAQQVLEIARLHKHLGIKTVINALINIWRRNTFQSPDRQPWWYPTPNEEWNLPHSDTNIARLYSGTMNNSPTKAEFRLDEEPEVGFIFEKVKSICETGVIFSRTNKSKSNKQFEATAVTVWH